MSHTTNAAARNTPGAASKTLTNSQTAEMLGVSTKYLNNMRYTGRGPAFIRLSKRRVVYKSDVVEAWMQAHTIATVGA